MTASIKITFFAVLIFLSSSIFSSAQSDISHGPMLGEVSPNSAAIWLRTEKSMEVTLQVSPLEKPEEITTQKFKTDEKSDFTIIARSQNLAPDKHYRYLITAGETKAEGFFTTTGPARKNKSLRMVYGYGYNTKENKMDPTTSIFVEMAKRKADAVFFLGDFPYTTRGARKEIHAGTKELREVIGFKELTRSTPTYGIYDDHDFGPNDCDGTHEFADEALLAFKEYWPNPSYGLPNDKGNYCSQVIGDVEFFLLDGRYPARMKEKTALGKTQFAWLCKGLKKSKSRYKVLVSGTQFGRAKRDGWAGENYVAERDRIFSFINDNGISGVIGISGDVHRNDIYKLPIGKNRFFYDFTPGALSRESRTPPNPLPTAMIYSYGKKDDVNLFGEIEFYPATKKDVAIVFRSFSGKNGLIHEHTLSPADLNLE
ncbi:MAG: alkaline phosphatase D family protein [Verrucomicrobiales bacterium]|nr:alkaline phosphatase D family protein [Verrucomicrobiales bacterium]